MEFEKYRTLNLPSESGYKHLLEIQRFLNLELYNLFIEKGSSDRRSLANALIEKVESLIDEINNYGYNLHRADYSGDINYENSEQTYSNKSLTIQFRGYSAQVSWDAW